MYGILYHSGYITSSNKQTNFLSYYFAHPEGHVGSHSFHVDDWDGWGAPIRYFSFPDEDFIDMVAFLMHSDDAFEDDEWAFDEEFDYDELWAEDEDWEDEAEKFYNQGKNKKSNNVSFIDDDNLPL